MFNAAFITDLHFGVKNNSEIFLNNIKDYLYNEFIPSLKEKKIEHVFVGGDVFDSRATINVKTLSYVFDFFTELQNNGFKVVVISGNHDLYLSTSNDYTSLAFLSKFSNVTFVRTGLQRVKIDDTNIMFIPWVSDQEKFVAEEINLLTKYNDCNVCIGHFELMGFKMSKTSKVMDEGLPPTILTNIFKTIISGHYHTRNEKLMENGSKVIYVGSPYQLTRADTEDSRGYCLLTFDKNNLVGYEFINNQKAIRFESITFPQDFTEQQIKNNVVDIYVNFAEKFDELALEQYKARVEAMGPAFKPEIKLVNAETLNVSTELDGFAVKTTLDLINEFIDGIELDKKENVRAEIISLYEQVKTSE